MVETVQMVPVAGGAIACRTWAPAEPCATLVLLHGFGGDSLTWGMLAPLLVARGWRVVAPDLPAHGLTPIEADTPEALLPPLAALLRQRDGAPPALAGHSLGGAVAARLASQHPVRSLTLLAPAGLGPEVDADLIRGIAAIDTGAQLRALLQRVANAPPPVPLWQLDELAALLGPRGRLRRLAEALTAGGRQTLDIVPDLARLTVPARVLFGLQDSVLPWTQVRAVPARVAIHLLSEANHALHWDQPALVAELLALG